VSRHPGDRRHPRSATHDLANTDAWEPGYGNLNSSAVAPGRSRCHFKPVLILGFNVHEHAERIVTLVLGAGKSRNCVGPNFDLGTVV